MTDPTSFTPAQRYRVAPDAGAPVRAACSPDSKTIQSLPQGTIVVCAEVRGEDRIRISSPAGWMAASELVPAEPASSLRIEYETFLSRHLQLAPGDHYGLEFPISFDLLREFGAEFLTAAFRAAGTISEDNEVREIVAIEPLDIPGASENGFLTVAYARPEPGLHTELFVKLPAEDADFKFGLSSMAEGEVEMARLSREGTLPFPVARYYYGDHSAHTTNSILITERIPFGQSPIEPAYRKGWDHEVPEVREHYRVLVEALASLVAAHKSGALGIEIERAFPFARAARRFRAIQDAENKVDQLVDFVGRIAPQLFVAESTKPAFLERWREDLLFGLVHKDAVIAYLHRDVDYTGLCHVNLNIDNAWYWRDDAGELHVGLVDWGGAGQLSIAQALSSMLMMPDPEIYADLQREVITTFVREYEKCGGMHLDSEELRFQYKASLFSTAICTIVDIIVGLLPQFSESDYASMESRFDPRLLESGMVSAIIWIDNILRDWLDDLTPGDACRRIVTENL